LHNNHISNAWKHFTQDDLIAVVLPEPKNSLQEYLWAIAHKFGSPTPAGYCDGVKFLYGQRMHGSGNNHDIEADMVVIQTGIRLFVPHWVTMLPLAINQIKNDEVANAYERGKSHGKSLLQRMATGDMTVLSFEDSRS